MSRLYGSLDADASKTTATRRAHRNITGHVRGWNSGVEIRAYVDEQDRDVFEVYRTGGSNGGLAPRMVARIVGDTVERMESGERLNVAGAITADGPQPAPGTPEGWGVDWV